MPIYICLIFPNKSIFEKLKYPTDFGKFEIPLTSIISKITIKKLLNINLLLIEIQFSDLM